MPPLIRILLCLRNTFKYSYAISTTSIVIKWNDGMVNTLRQENVNSCGDMYS